MGTRSLTVINNEEGKEIVVMYRQMDGYPTGHGAELAEFLQDMALVNGYGSNTPAKAANGMSCLAAQIIAYFKDGIGNFYLYPAGTRDAGEEYIYTVSAKDGKINLKVTVGATTFFGMPGTKEENMPVLYDGPVTEFDPKEAEKQAEQKEPVNDYIEAQ